MPDHPLDDATRAALAGPHAALAQVRGGARRYDPDVAPFAAPPRSPDEWDDLAALVGPGGTAIVPAIAPLTPARTAWAPVQVLAGVQMVDDGVAAREEPEAVVLGTGDVAEILDLVERTRPGPFRERTVTMGRYLGLRDADGALVAMAGERLHPPGWCEVSGVCTDPAHRGRGLAARLVRAVAAGIRARGETPFLHTTASNTPAIRLYADLGFRLRARPSFHTLRAPARVVPDIGAGATGHPAPSASRARRSPP